MRATKFGLRREYRIEESDLKDFLDKLKTQSEEKKRLTASAVSFLFVLRVVFFYQFPRRYIESIRNAPQCIGVCDLKWIIKHASDNVIADLRHLGQLMHRDALFISDFFYAKPYQSTPPLSLFQL